MCQKDTTEMWQNCIGRIMNYVSVNFLYEHTCVCVSPLSWSPPVLSVVKRSFKGKEIEWLLGIFILFKNQAIYYQNIFVCNWNIFPMVKLYFVKASSIGNKCCYSSFHRNLRHLPSMNIIAVISFPFRVLTQQLQYKDRCNALDDFTVSLNKDKQVLLSTCLRVHMHAIFHVSCVLGDLFN